MPKQKTKKKRPAAKKVVIKKKKNSRKSAMKKKKPAKKAVSKKRSSRSSNKKSAPKRASKNLGRRIPVKTLSGETAESILGSALAEDNNKPGLNDNYNFSLASASQPVPEDNEAQTNEFEDFDFGELQEEAEMNQSDSLEIEENDGYEKHADLTQRQKTALMYIAVACIMVVIGSFWFLAVKNSLGQFIVSNSLDEEQQKANQETKNAFDDLKNDLNKIQDVINQSSNSVDDFTNQAKTKVIETQIKNNVANKIQDDLEKGQIDNTNSVNNNLNTNP